MQKLQNNTLQIFLDKFIEELKRENSDRKYHEKMEMDIPFIVSSLYQSFNNYTNKYIAFIKDLEKYVDYNIVIADSNNEYSRVIDVEIYLYRDFEVLNKPCDYPDYNYLFQFTYDTRDYGYCECTPDMPDYREDKHCCGHGCDAVFCKFSLHKVFECYFSFLGR